MASSSGSTNDNWRSRVSATLPYLAALAALGLVALSGNEADSVEPLTQAVSTATDRHAPVVASETAQSLALPD